MKMPINALILTEDRTVGCQLSILLESHGWRIGIVDNDFDAYRAIYGKRVDVVISDIGSWGTGGLAVMVWCKRHCPWVVSYAICRRGQQQLMYLAQEYGGCEGHFYLSDGDPLQLDIRHGMMARFLGRSMADAEAVQVH